MSDTKLLCSRVLLSRKEASALTGLSPKTVAKLIASRELRSIRVGRRRLIPRADIDQFVKRDHRISVLATVALRRRPKKHKNRNSRNKRKGVTRNRGTRQTKRSSRIRHVTRRKKGRLALTDPRVARALGLMRREGISASAAAKGAGKYLHRPSPGKPYKARSEDELAFSMQVLTVRGREAVIVRNSRERKLLHEYEVALRMFRAAEDGAEAELKKFEGKTVGGHVLITDLNVLIQLEEADQIDVETFYTAIGARS
jgi:excisionase family DNA binding protein